MCFAVGGAILELRVFLSEISHQYHDNKFVLVFLPLSPSFFIQEPVSGISLAALVQPILPRGAREARPARDSHHPLSAPLADLQAVERLLLPSHR